MLNRDYIFKLLREKNWSQVEFATYAGVSTAAISRWLSGRRKGSSVMMQAIKKAFPEEKADNLFLFTQSVSECQQTTSR